MAIFSWVAQMEELTSAALTVRAQAIPFNDRGTLLWDVFFPRQNVDSVIIEHITTLNYRPTASRREWNQRGRAIPLERPSTGKVELVPIESFFRLGEREIQSLMERASGNEELFKQLVSAPVPERSDMLALAAWRQLEYDTMQSWSNGRMTILDPQNATTYNADWPFRALTTTRFQTQDWSAANNAYDLFLVWLEEAQINVGQVQGAMMRLATAKKIQADAPQGIRALPLSRVELNDQLSRDLDTPFRIFTNENTIDKFDDAGQDFTTTKVWTADQVAVIPVGTTVGQAAFAPIVRAHEIARGTPEASIDVRGITVYSEISGNGRELTVEAQLNAIPIPDEQRMFVVDAQV